MCANFWIFFFFTVSKCQTVLEVLDALEEESDVKDLWITPPVMSFASDEDSGDDDGGHVDNLSGKQLHAPASTVLGDGRVLGEEDDSEEDYIAYEPFQDTLHATTRTQKDSIKYKWTKVAQSLQQIPPDPRLQPNVSLNGPPPLKRFDFFFDDVFDHFMKETI